MPPIYQPEVAAQAIYYAAHNPARREYYVGWSTLKAIFVNKLVPSLGDHYLARIGYDSQQHDGPENPDRPNNLWETVPGNFGAHGSFEGRARSLSLEFWAEAHTKWLAVAAGLGIAGAALSALTHARISPRNHAAVHRNKQRSGSQAA